MSRLALTPTNVPSSATAISTPTLRAGDLYYNTTTGLMIYSGSAWVSVAGVTSVNGSTGAITNVALTTGNLSQFAATTSAQLAGVISDETGTGSLVFATSPTLVSPALGTPSSGTLTSCTGLPVSTGVSGLGTGVATFLATPTSANLLAAVTNETGTGAVVFGTNPSLTAPLINLGYTAKTASYACVLADNGYLFTMNSASATTFTIPTNATQAFPVGAQINFAWITGAGQPTIQATTPATTTILSTGATSTAPKLRVANSMASAVKIATDTWIVTGDIA